MHIFPSFPPALSRYAYVTGLHFGEETDIEGNPGKAMRQGAGGGRAGWEGRAKGGPLAWRHPFQGHQQAAVKALRRKRALRRRPVPVPPWVPQGPELPASPAGLRP